MPVIRDTGERMDLTVLQGVKGNVLSLRARFEQQFSRKTPRHTNGGARTHSFLIQPIEPFTHLRRGGSFSAYPKKP